jgi:hypothetical protein
MKRLAKYQKNLAIVEENGQDYIRSYETLVGKIDKENKQIIELGKWSATTTRHINYVADVLSFEIMPYTGKKTAIEKEQKDEVNGVFNFMNMFLMLGDLQADENNYSKQVKYKEQIIFATMRSLIPHWQKPTDWDEISDIEKMARLRKLEEVINNGTI